MAPNCFVANRERCVLVSIWLIALLIWLLPALLLAPMLLWTGLAGRRRSGHIRSAGAARTSDGKLP